ncbi:Serine phosphatase RsbU, regulator of sigma subunit [hydrothermal vent metagenome]|uniref:Serine phosphatase RsbU, regulator of sigma subunit n=1 Tax=hydrothermal vent metagenome TaxID=652676 RepID=A0A3B1C7Y7_9ZZZZ
MAKILAVDDVEDNIFLLKMILESHGHQVYTALNGKEALELAEENPVDLILLDLMMPDMDGMEAASRLKSMEMTRHVPIILLTAKKKEVSDVVEALQSGADEYITKPFNETELMARVGSMLRMKTLYDQVASAHKMMEEDLSTAQCVQKTLLPVKFPYPDKIKVCAHYEATSSLGGDYYDVIDYGDGKVGALVADVSGHGASAALIMSMIKTIMISSIDGAATPAKLAHLLNKRIIGMIPEERYFTMFLAIVDLNERKLSYVRGGHPYPFLLRKQSKIVEKLDAEGDMIAMFGKITVNQSEIEVNPGDRLVAYSDGLIEAVDFNDKMYGINRLVKELESSFAMESNELLDHLVKSVNDFSGGRSNDDDVAVLIIEFL